MNKANINNQQQTQKTQEMDMKKVRPKGSKLMKVANVHVMETVRRNESSIS